MGAYRGRIVSECLQVSDIGVDKPPRVLDVHAHVVIGSIGNEDSHTETDMSSEVYQSRPAEGGIIPLTCFYNILHARSIGMFLLQEMRFQRDSHDEDSRGDE